MRSRNLILAFSILIMSGLVGWTFAQNQSEKPGSHQASASSKDITTKAKTRSASEPDPNIKSESQKNNPKANMTPPAAGKTRGPGPFPCGVRIINHTPWWANVYVDGNWVGAVNGFGVASGIYGNGPTTVYTVAPMNDGTTRNWGPEVLPCDPRIGVTWHMWP